MIPCEYNYNIFRNDHPDGYGGVLIAISSHLSSSPVIELHTSCEMVWAKIQTNNSTKPLYVCAYYRAHISDQTSLEQLDTSLAKLFETSENASVWLASDFNAPHVNWMEFVVTPGLGYMTIQNNLIDITLNYGLSQTVLEPTRLDNILDVFFTNSPSQINKVEITPGFSDHNIVHIHTSLKPKTLKQNKRHILLYNKADWESIKFGLKMFYEELSSIDLKQVDTNSLWLRFHNKLTELIDLYIPKKISRKRCTSPWITPELRRLMRKRNRLF